MAKDRFSDYDDDVRKLVLDFEYTVMKGESQFFDVDEFEVIIDYYFQVNDEESLANALAYAEQLYPDSPSIKQSRANWYIAKGKFDKAKAILLELEDQNHEDTDVAYSLGLLYSELGNSERAIDYFLLAATDGWQLGKIYYNIAEEYFSLQQYDNAIEYYLKAFNTDSYDVETLYAYLDACELSERVSEAVNFLQRFTRVNPYCREAWFCLGSAFNVLYDFDNAIDAFEYAIAIDKNFTEAYLGLSKSYVCKECVGEAATTLTRLLEVESDHAFVYRALGELYFRQANFDAAQAYFRHALSENDENAESHAWMSLCCMHLDDVSTASVHAARAIKLDPRSPNAMCALALVGEAMGEKKKAEELFEAAIESEYCTDIHRRHYCLFLFRTKSYEKLFSFVENELEYTPHDQFYSTYFAAACFYTNRYNTLKRTLSDVNIQVLWNICPVMWENPVISPLLPTDVQSFDL